MRQALILAALGAMMFGAPSWLNAQVAVVGVANPDALFVSDDIELNRNKRAAYHIVKNLLEANHWELAEMWINQD